MMMGGEVYHAYSNNALMQAEPKIAQLTREINAIQQEIDFLELKIKEVKNEKTCSCGKVVQFDTKFCPSCGNKFELQVLLVDAIPEGAKIVAAECLVCHAALKPGAEYCGSCGCRVPT